MHDITAAESAYLTSGRGLDQQSCHIQKTWLHSSLHFFLKSLYLSSKISQSLWGRSCDPDVLCRTEHSLVSHSLLIDQTWVSVLITINHIRKFLWWGLRALFIYVCKDGNLGHSLMLQPFSRIVAVDSPLGTMAYPIMGSWWPDTWQCFVTLSHVSHFPYPTFSKFKNLVKFSNQKAVRKTFNSTV